MKLTLKLFLVVCLFSSVSFAQGDTCEGDMTGGGITCTCEGDMTGGGYTCEGDMTGGGITCTCEDNSSTTNNTTQEESGDSILDFVQEYLSSLFG